ncbi:uncharacterized protein LOC122190628 isoform X3 [Lagopus leucura]|uniref:uncharacterized protein LOC122190628 isoform X3 n=1 Tax=Lagopus leucura TaxID=30410 RepID=UPI001C67417B|nr:uncharacterized protein LOC122190628 isoform X3 [Lagopus leucura]
MQPQSEALLIPTASPAAQGGGWEQTPQSFSLLRLSKKNSSNPIPSRACRPALCLSWKRSPMAVLLLAVLLLAVLLPTAPSSTAPLPPTPRELARTVLEAHGRDAGSGLRLLKLQGVTRTKFDWGTHFTINLTAREISCPAGPTAPRSAACRARPGQQIQHCVAQISVFAFLPDVPLSLLECSRQTPSSSGQPRSRSRHSPATPRAVGLREPAPS